MISQLLYYLMPKDYGHEYEYGYEPDEEADLGWMDSFHRFLSSGGGYYSNYSYGNSSNSTISNVTDDDYINILRNTDDFASKLHAADDVSVDAVVTSIWLNLIAFCVLMAAYECLRRLLPSVYSSQVKSRFKAGQYSYDGAVEDSADDISRDGDGLAPAPPRGGRNESTTQQLFDDFQRETSMGALPDVLSSFFWVPSVFSVSWSQVRRIAGLDGYFFLRFIRMNVRICSVTMFWAFIILVPLYATGDYQNNEVGWYHISVANVAKGSWRMWIPSCFAYLMSGFIFFVIKQEYRHYLELRMDFLARGTEKVHPQHHYSLKVENIPYELRSEKALYDYFDKLFPGKIHSATVVLNLPDLEAVKARCLRVCRRLEKSIAYCHATGKRATHNVGSPRISVLGVDLAPFDWSCGSYPEVAFVDERTGNNRPQRGTHVDSISYYTHDLAICNKNMYHMQQRKTDIAVSGNVAIEADHWLSRMMLSAYEVADRIMIDSAEDNALKATYSSFDDSAAAIPQAEQMSSRYGSFGPISGVGSVTARSAQCNPYSSFGRHRLDQPSFKEGFLDDDSVIDRKVEDSTYRLPGTTIHTSKIRRVAGRLGLDFAVSGVKFFNRQIDSALESVVGATMSSTGFVTFLDLTSITCAASTPLTSKPQILEVSVAPEPRDIIWDNAHVSAKSCKRNERMVNLVLIFGVFFWIFPLAAIQAFAKAEYIAKIPGMEWILTFDGGSVSTFVNGYLPVVALLCLILVLPLIFQFVATNYERRKTISEVQKSMLNRYFFYQLVNIYITVTAGSLWKSLSEILDHPTSLLSLLGESLPSMVGYFVALLVTKILAGLPMVFLRVGALSRMILYRSISSSDKLTQRELDQIYRAENVQYGWEFPTQLLVIVIVFTYAVICPIILPFGLLYFLGALLVYKKQVLYVYQPVYESGGAMFPSAIQRALFGLVCGQLTLIGYFLTRGFYYQPLFLLPLPLATIWGMGYFHRHYADPSSRLSLERAREYDRVSEALATGKDTIQTSSGSDLSVDPAQYGVEARRKQFDKKAYRQPVLTQKPMLPKRYRRDQDDPLTEDCRKRLLEIQGYLLLDEEGRAGEPSGDEKGIPPLPVSSSSSSYSRSSYKRSIMKRDEKMEDSSKESQIV